VPSKGSIREGVGVGSAVGLKIRSRLVPSFCVLALATLFSRPCCHRVQSQMKCTGSSSKAAVKGTTEKKHSVPATRAVKKANAGPVGSAAAAEVGVETPVASEEPTQKKSRKTTAKDAKEEVITCCGCEARSPQQHSSRTRFAK